MIMNRIHRNILTLISVFLLLTGLQSSEVFAQHPLRLSFEDAVNIAFDRSFDVIRIRKNYQRDQMRVKATRASLNSFSNLRVDLPNMEKQIERLFTDGSYTNSETQTTTWQANWSVSQPIISNGTFSLKSDLLTFAQKNDTRKYKNKVFLEFKQPLFTRNSLRMDIWRAEERFRTTEYSSISQLIRQYGRFNRFYYELFKLNRQYEIDSLIVDISLEAYREALDQQQQNGIDSTEVARLEVDYLLNKSRLLKTEVEQYQRELEFKVRIGISPDQPVLLTAEAEIIPVEINEEQALQLGLTERPSIMEKEVDVAFARDDVEIAKTRSEFKGSLEATYGIERVNEEFSNIFSEFDKTQSLELQLEFPLWDSKRNFYQVESRRMEYEEERLDLENTRLSRANDVRNSLRAVRSSLQRAESLKINLERAKNYYSQMLAKFRNREIKAQELSRALEEFRNVQNRYLDAFVGYNRSMIDLQQKTLWDFEENISLKEKFRMYLQAGN